MKKGFIIVGLGNPREEYLDTRHNTGERMLEVFRQKLGFPDWQEDKKSQVLVSKGELNNVSVTLLLPQTMMNNSGKSLKSLSLSTKGIRNLVVVNDELDLPLGTIKTSFNRGAGGHRGVESIIKQLKTKEFVRLRVGISRATASGKARKPTPGKVTEFILGKFTPSELATLKKMEKTFVLNLKTIIESGFETAMNLFN